MTVTDTLRCVFCGGVINPALDYRKVVGFERHRSQGGTNALRLRQTQDQWACWSCVDRQAKGLHARQESLI